MIAYFRIIPIILLISTLLPIASISQSRSIEIIDSLTAITTSGFVQSDQGKLVQQYINQHPGLVFSGSPYLISEVISQFETSQLGLVKSFDGDKSNSGVNKQSRPILSIDWLDRPLSLRRDQESGELIRTFDSSLRVLQQSADSVIVLSYKIEGHAFCDTIPDDKLQYLSESQWGFSKVATPPESDSLWETVLEPVVIIGSAILSVYLLFSIRSN